MKLNKKNIDGITVIEPEGRMTVNNIYSFTKLIERNLFPFTGKIEDPSGISNSRVILDMKGVEAIDSSGLGTILFLAKKCRALGGDLKIVSISPEVSIVFEIANFDKIFHIYSSLDDAVKSYRLQGRRPLQSNP
jgi:anti-anti-sigma factor